MGGGSPTYAGLPPQAQTPEGYAAYAAESSAGPLFAATIALTIVGSIVLILRLISRKVSHLGFWWDDYIAVLAWAMAMVTSMQGLVLPGMGLGHHTSTVLDKIPQEGKTRYFLAMWYLLQLSTVKTAVLLMYRRIFPVVPLRAGIRKLNFYTVAWWFVLFCVVGYGISFTVVAIRPCVPIWGIWVQPPPKLECLNSSAAYWAAGWNIVLDCMVLSLPIYNICKLQLTFLQKIYLCAIFLLGSFVTITSGIRIYWQTHALDTTDTLFNVTVGYLWTEIEVWTGVICSCVPILGPLVDKLLGKHRLWSPHSSHKTSPTSTTTDESRSNLKKKVSLDMHSKQSESTLADRDLEAAHPIEHTPSTVNERDIGIASSGPLPERPPIASRVSQRDANLTGGYQDSFPDPPFDGPSPPECIKFQKERAAKNLKERSPPPPGATVDENWAERSAPEHAARLANLKKQRQQMDDRVGNRYPNDE